MGVLAPKRAADATANNIPGESWRNPVRAMVETIPLAASQR